jgi:hypothetical protein
MMVPVERDASNINQAKTAPKAMTTVRLRIKIQPPMVILLNIFLVFGNVFFIA